MKECESAKKRKQASKFILLECMQWNQYLSHWNYIMASGVKQIEKEGLEVIFATLRVKAYLTVRNLKFSNFRPVSFYSECLYVRTV